MTDEGPGLGAGERRGPPGGEDALAALGVDRISHQLKNPLQTISVNLEVLRLRSTRAASPEEVDEIERLAGVVESGVRTLDRRIGMLVDLARRSSDSEWRRLRLGRYVRDAAATFRLDERERGRALEVDVPGEEEDVEVRVRPGWLLALLLAAAGRSPDDGAFRVVSREEGAILVLPVRAATGEGDPDPELPRRLTEAIRRAGGDPTEREGRLAARFPGA